MRPLRKVDGLHVDHNAVVERVPNLDPVELRATAARLLSVANSIESASQTRTRSLALAEAERDELACVASPEAEAEYHARGRRYMFFSKALLGEPAWDILLDLYIQKVRLKRVSITDVCLASGVPQTTALRCLSALESEGMIERVQATHDRRVHYLGLTNTAELALTRWLKYRVPS